MRTPTLRFNEPLTIPKKKDFGAFNLLSFDEIIVGDELREWVELRDYQGELTGEKRIATGNELEFAPYNGIVSEVEELPIGNYPPQSHIYKIKLAAT